jgi:NAD(P)-dependent dehydrogenase (short-subunit alcohol dehydrogenase family)
MAPPEQLLALPFLQADQVKDSLHAYQLAKRGNSLRVMAEAVRWGKRGARINTISPGIIITPLAKDELTGPRGEGYRRMIEHWHAQVCAWPGPQDPEPCEARLEAFYVQPAGRDRRSINLSLRDRSRTPRRAERPSGAIA